MAKGLTLAAGKVYRIRHYHEPGLPVETKLNAAVAKRCEWAREQIFGPDYANELVCNVFRDKKTGHVYIDYEHGWAWKPTLHIEPKRERKKHDEDRPKRVHVDESAPTCFRANPGTALRYYPKAKKVVLVPLRAKVTERFKYIGLRKLTFEGVDYYCAMFEDPKNGVLYGQVSDEEVSDADAGE